jgi:hypothetical protein
VSGSSFAVGVTTVTCTATDGAGNAASSSFAVTVTSTGGLPPTGGLPATGTYVLRIILLAVVLTGLGALLIDVKRRRRL